ncbi:PQQ-binding-like beta-propeller repeat protein [Halorubellus salinus]|uniref:PQQ-binding-like beta-propeller repeat protein n=1 Tax=Halorubellus salinus TaxID=755309 RepID=UPI001D06A275|nr:PQQ-binding-like beta-propeller repeat protein [Halorubellus salinus]
MRSTRRGVLAAAGTALLAGCSTFDGVQSDGERSVPPPFLAEPEDWAHPGHGPGNARRARGDAAPRHAPDGATWRRELSASTVDSVAQPVVADGVAYVAFVGVDRGTEFARLVALDLDTGAVRWVVEVSGTAYAGAPRVAGETVLWRGGADTLYAFHAADGSERWTWRVRNHVDPVAAHGLALVTVPAEDDGDGEELVAVDVRDGDAAWTRREADRGWLPHAADDDRFYVTRTNDGSSAGALLALDHRTGEIAWSAAGVAPRSLVVAGGRAFSAIDASEGSEFLALDTADDEPGWSRSRAVERETDDGTVTGEETVAAATADVVVASQDFHGRAPNRVVARDAATGDVTWTVGDEDLSVAPSALPFVCGDALYVPVDDDAAGDNGEDVERTAPALSVHALDDGSVRDRQGLDVTELVHVVVADGSIVAVARPSGNAVSVAAW